MDDFVCVVVYIYIYLLEPGRAKRRNKVERVQGFLSEKEYTRNTHERTQRKEVAVMFRT